MAKMLLRSIVAHYMAHTKSRAGLETLMARTFMPETCELKGIKKCMGGQARITWAKVALRDALPDAIAYDKTSSHCFKLPKGFGFVVDRVLDAEELSAPHVCCESHKPLEGIVSTCPRVSMDDDRGRPRTRKAKAPRDSESKSPSATGGGRLSASMSPVATREPLVVKRAKPTPGEPSDPSSDWDQPAGDKASVRDLADAAASVIDDAGAALTAASADLEASAGHLPASFASACQEAAALGERLARESEAAAATAKAFGGSVSELIARVAAAHVEWQRKQEADLKRCAAERAAAERELAVCSELLSAERAASDLVLREGAAERKALQAELDKCRDAAAATSIRLEAVQAELASSRALAESTKKECAAELDAKRAECWQLDRRLKEASTKLKAAEEARAAGAQELQKRTEQLAEATLALAVVEAEKQERLAKRQRMEEAICASEREVDRLKRELIELSRTM